MSKSDVVAILRFLGEVKLTSRKKKLTFLTHSISETSKATIDKERFLESGELTL